MDDFEPPEGSPHADGRGAWHELVKEMNKQDVKDMIANHYDFKIRHSKFTGKSGVTISKHINDFTKWYSEMKKVDRLPAWSGDPLE